jgi:ATP-dependent Clp protease ATP-binding subunit ClpA
VRAVGRDGEGSGRCLSGSLIPPGGSSGNAQEECLRLHHDRIGTEHVLLGLLRDGVVVAESLAAVGVSLARARLELERARGKPEQPSVGQVPFTPRAKQELEQSLRVTRRLGQD